MTRRRPRREAAKPGSKEPACRRERRPVRQKPEGREGVRGEEPPSQALRGSASCGARGPARQKPEGREDDRGGEPPSQARQEPAGRGLRGGPRGRNLGLAAKSPREMARKRLSYRTLRRPWREDAKPGPKEPASRGMRGPGARAPASETSASQRRRRERELDGALVQDAKAPAARRRPSQARRSRPAAGREGPRGRSSGPATKGPKVRA